MPEPVRHRRAPGHVWRRWRGSVLVMGPSLEPVELAGAAAVVWSALDAPCTTHELDAGLGCAPDDGAPSVADVLAELVAQGLVANEDPR